MTFVFCKYFYFTFKMMGFPGGSAAKESACNAGDLGAIPGLGRSPGEGKGYPVQYSWAFLVAQLAKNLPAMWETWVRSLGWKDPLEKEKATYCGILAWRIPWTEEPGRLQSMGSILFLGFSFITYISFLAQLAFSSSHL